MCIKALYIMWLYQISDGLSHIFFPRLCEGCKAPLTKEEAVLCLVCRESLPRTHHYHLTDNEVTLRFAGRFPFHFAVSFVYFTNQGLVQHLLHRLKYQGKKNIGIFLGEQFALALQPTDWIGAIDMILPVPLHKKKELVRGYNQSIMIAEGMNRVLSIPYPTNILLRVRHTESQTLKTRIQRTENMKDAFVVHDSLEGKHVLLLDDVLTTGATLETCALAVLQQGAASVSLATIGLAI